MIITIDGPAASGKSTIAHALAKDLNYFYIASGFLYRAYAYTLEAELLDEAEENLYEYIESVHLEYTNDKDAHPVIIINGEQLSLELLQHEEISKRASKISGHKALREYILTLERKIAQNKNIVVDGRDSGTHVFPFAQLKFFLIASVEARARRLCTRQKEAFYSFEQCCLYVQERDTRDVQRMHAPLRPAEDAIIVDNTHMSIEQTLMKLKTVIKEKIKD